MEQISRTLGGLLAGHDPSSVALLGEGGVTLTRKAVCDAVDGVATQLAANGIRRDHRIAIVMQNGPDAALSFLSAANAGVAAPLNPAYKEAEFRFAMNDLPATLLLTDGSSLAASAAAAGLGIPTLNFADLRRVSSSGSSVAAPAADGSDVALILHTSGTTGAPKRVPLTHANLTASAANIAESLAITPADRCLNIMPLFHIHGLVAAVLATLASGGSVVCTPGFDSFRMFSWLETFRPTWFTAVPTMHQAILARARSRAAAPVAHNLRFVRSSSSPLPSSVHSEVERLFEVPLIEAYGMTEASHQIATNPLPPASRLTGSVGLPSGVEIALFAPDGSRMTNGGPGEVAIRGKSITRGYEGIDAKEFMFPGGWLRTGDEGRLDEHGYLHLVGRLKEFVNRGGEKISPREVEEALLAHPSVIEAVVFSLPHELLGEEVAAAVVLSSDCQAPTPTELRAFIAERLAAFKVPRKILFVERIPLGPTGKPQRVGMGQRLGIV